MVAVQQLHYPLRTGLDREKSLSYSIQPLSPSFIPPTFLAAKGYFSPYFQPAVNYLVSIQNCLFCCHRWMEGNL